MDGKGVQSWWLIGCWGDQVWSRMIPSSWCGKLERKAKGVFGRTEFELPEGYTQVAGPADS